MLSAVVVAVLVAAFVLVAGVAAWAVRRLWTAADPAERGSDGAATAAGPAAADATPEA